MNLNAAFIGINRYRDDNVSDLSGAVRDARALHALFTDTFALAKSRLLLDDQATYLAVEQCLSDLLEHADDDEIVLVSFSGHGSDDYRFVLHDSDPAFWEATSLSMERLAELFRTSPAKAILIILDCCFSGEAPAKVFSTGMKSRSGTPGFSVIAGTGRVLIAAANSSEVAWESSKTGHGLLTHALIEVLTELKDSTGISSIMEQVVHRVQTRAREMGRTQTPIQLGLIEGGLTLPPLVKGQLYATCFPELGALHVGAALDDLAAAGLPVEVLDEWKRHLPFGLNALQQDAINEGGLLRGESVCVVAPTSAGKTFVGEMAAIRAAAAGQKAVFLVPYKALANEHYERFRRVYEAPLHLRVIRCTGDFSDTASRFLSGKFDIAVMTFEMFLGLALSRRASLERVGLAVLDEAHFIADPARGITVELILTLLRALGVTSEAPQLVLLSAVIGETRGLEEWLGAKLLRREARPVALVEGVLDRAGTYQRVLPGEQLETEQLLHRHEIQQRKDKPSSQDLIVPLVRKLVGTGQKVMIFRNTRGLAAGCARYLADELSLPSADHAISQLPRHDTSTATRDLQRCLAGGTAFHTTNLTPAERIVVEESFRDPSSPVRVLAATSTVAAGVNLPAETVIIAEHEFRGQPPQPYTVSEYRNMAGRAGRLGLATAGRSILLAQSSIERQRLFRDYVQAPPTDLRSSFSEGSLDEWVLRLLAQVDGLLREDIPNLVANTFGGFLHTRQNPAWETTIRRRTDTVLDEFLGLALVEEREYGLLHLSLLGRACASSSLALRSALAFLNLATRRWVGNLSAMDLATLVQGIPEMDSMFTPLNNKAAKDRVWAGQLGGEASRALQYRVDDQPQWMRRCKRALMLKEWVAGSPVEQIEKGFSVTPYQPVGFGDIRGTADNTRFHLRSVYELLQLAAPDRAPDADAVDELIVRLEFGLPAEFLGLLELPVALTRGQMLALGQAGATTLEAMSALDETSLTDIVGEELRAAVRAITMSGTDSGSVQHRSPT